MTVFNAAFPILAGKVQAARAFAEEVMGPRRSQFEDHQRRRGVTRETWSVQETPDGGAFSVVWIESPDPQESIAASVRDPSEFAVWFRERVKEINGVELDPAQPLPGSVELTLDWRA